jgi:hypothetical protein
MTTIETENQKSAAIAAVRSDYKVVDMFLDLEKQIVGTISKISEDVLPFPPSELAKALSDRELLTLELWAGDEHKVIADEVKRRRGEYEKFVSRFGERA